MKHYFRQPRENPIFSRPVTKAKTYKPKTMSSVELPSIYTRQLRLKIPEVCLQNANDVRREISRLISFKKDRVPCLIPELYEQVPEEIKAIAYSSSEYEDKLEVVAKIFGCCDLSVKERDIMIARGKKSQACYVFFTNFVYHPQSLCCNQAVIMKCLEKRGIDTDESKEGLRRWQMLCIGCLKVFLKIRETEERYQKSSEAFDYKRKLLDFALHVASGRYKRHLLEEDPVGLSYQHVKSRFTHIYPKKGTESVQ